MSQGILKYKDLADAFAAGAVSSKQVLDAFDGMKSAMKDTGRALKPMITIVGTPMTKAPTFQALIKNPDNEVLQWKRHMAALWANDAIVTNGDPICDDMTTASSWTSVNPRMRGPDGLVDLIPPETQALLEKHVKAMMDREYPDPCFTSTLKKSVSPDQPTPGHPDIGTW